MDYIILALATGCFVVAFTARAVGGFSNDTATYDSKKR